MGLRAGAGAGVAGKHPDVVARLARAYDAWWQSVQPDLVNEDLDGPPENPFRTAFWAEFGREATAAPAGDVAPPPVAR